MAQTRDFILPDLGEGLTEGTIVNWLVKAGDKVEVDQPLAEMETAKAVVEVSSPFEGVVTALHGEVGDEVEVGQPLVTIDVQGPGEAGPPAEEAAPEAAAVGPKDEAPEGASPKDAETGDMVPSAADEVDTGSGNVLVGYGTGAGARARRRRKGKGPAASAPPRPISDARPPAAPAAPPRPISDARPPAAPAAPPRPRAKPPVRKMAKDLGIDLAEVEGTGPEGTITREDVRAYAGDGRREAVAERPEPPVPVTAPQPPSPEFVERIPLRGIRKRIAEKMTVSRREIPEATSWVDCDATELWELRQELNAAHDDVAVSPLAIILRACVAALREFPVLNARLDTERDEIVVAHFVNLGFAAHTDRGLVVPVIKQADRQSTVGIARELNRLATLAREGKLAPDDMQGGTFTVSNYGSFGIDGGSAVINHPEAAILGVGRIADRPWAVDGTLAIRKVMQLSIAFDHRICDGGEAAGFLRYVADCCESRSKLLAAL